MSIFKTDNDDGKFFILSYLASQFHIVLLQRLLENSLPNISYILIFHLKERCFIAILSICAFFVFFKEIIVCELKLSYLMNLHTFSKVIISISLIIILLIIIKTWLILNRTRFEICNELPIKYVFISLFHYTFLSILKILQCLNCNEFSRIMLPCSAVQSVSKSK